MRGYLFAIPRIPSVPNNLRILVPFCGSVIYNKANEINYEEIVDFVKNQKGIHDIKYLKCILSIFNIKFSTERVIVVAGTNGKGTTSATISTLLIESRKNVDFFHLPT